MKIKKTGTTYEIAIEGPIGEQSPLFTYDVRDATKILIDGAKMTYINSIGVKNWITWTLKLSAQVQIELINVPLVMINQASTVAGFLPKQARIASFQAPYVCPDCGSEKMVPLLLGKDYQYASEGQPKQVNLPQVECSKCKAVMETDFLESKTFTFLSPQS